jgi:hypothetical protein
MGQFIPLKLQPNLSFSEPQFGSKPVLTRPFPPRVSSLPPRSSLGCEFRPVPPLPSHSRSSSLPSRPSFSSPSGYEVSPLPPLPLSARGSSLSPPMPPRSSERFLKEMPHLCIPSTDSEWRKTLEEVRALYVKRRYKQCSTRCISVLGDAMGPVSQFPYS